MSGLNPVVFICLEKIKVNHQMNITKAKKMVFHHKFTASQENHTLLMYEYKKILNKIEKLNSRSKEIGKEEVHLNN